MTPSVAQVHRAESQAEDRKQDRRTERKTLARLAAITHPQLMIAGHKSHSSKLAGQLLQRRSGQQAAAEGSQHRVLTILLQHIWHAVNSLLDTMTPG